MSNDKEKLDVFVDMGISPDGAGSFAMINKPETTDWAINIILDESDSQNPIFVEIETDKGRSISIGKRITLDGGLTRLRITVPEIIECN